MFKSSGGYDRLLDKATSHLLMDPDWPSILQICDLVRQDDVQPKYVMASLKKKLISTNPHTVYYTLLVLESLVKNCGSVFHEELTLRVNCEMLHELAKTTTHDNVRQKLLELVQVWTHAFRKNPKYSCMKEIMDAMKAEGYKFPVLAESDAMFTADSAPEWTDGEVCHRCRSGFGVLNRKHHCRNCGQVFCHQCSQKNAPLPKFGIEKEVRVCDACFDQVTKPVSKSKKSPSSRQDDSELPAEYLNSSLAQQSQVPPRKTEEELREEEEMQLALALSQSEAEAKEKEKLKGTTAIHHITKSEIRHIDRTPTPPPEEPAVANPELARYLNRSFWENRQVDVTESNRPTSPSAPSPAPTQTSEVRYQENGITDVELKDFINTLKSQVEIFINRMKSNCSRGRPVANDSSVQTLFLNITAMHSQLLRYIQQHDDSRLYFEGLQDKLTQVKDARAALDALRDEHREKLRRQAEEAERIRQLQMANKLDIMRKKKQEYLQYQRQLALQRVQEQEREMQMRQEQQKQQYLMGAAGYGNYSNAPVHNQFPPTAAAVDYRNFPYGQPMLMRAGPIPTSLPGQQNMQMVHPQMSGPGGIPPGMVGPQMAMANMLHQQHGSLGMSQVQPPGLPQVPAPGLQQIPPGLPQQQQPQMSQQIPPTSGIPQPSLAQQIPTSRIPSMGPHSIPLHTAGTMGRVPQGMPQFQQPGAPPASPQVEQVRQTNDAQTAELISFD